MRLFTFLRIILKSHPKGAFNIRKTGKINNFWIGKFNKVWKNNGGMLINCARKLTKFFFCFILGTIFCFWAIYRGIEWLKFTQIDRDGFNFLRLKLPKNCKSYRISGNYENNFKRVETLSLLGILTGKFPHCSQNFSI